ncbi:hypothetical protein HanXRQr2_Chr12g0563051 [Helianthus annuus]|uniref:S-adenosyl-L-methionine-dependent methyltransferase n=1 Tax=Helianthus annuus TaxID=4232 RepID=A0A9K3HK62_HELAN|nr:hypothetical protein HanXRQr2_Chr12g0563051 [Helianthus annuus]KAJ0495361.1 hypothetical protein HanIR_Chr12g0607951 [Helianthus annuus]KAJ0864493.1 hypothetical protein HanPSC8_Chr12g0542571 [Helianthus annuus]
MHLDLTLIAGAKEYVEAQPSRTELFRYVLICFKMAQEDFKPAGGILVDVSCGSGLFSRKFAKSRTYSKVITYLFSRN